MSSVSVEGSQLECMVQGKTGWLEIGQWPQYPTGFTARFQESCSLEMFPCRFIDMVNITSSFDFAYQLFLGKAGVYCRVDSRSDK